MLLGAVQLTSAWLDAALAVTSVGAAGGNVAVGVTAAEGSDAGPAPAGLEACTVKVYSTPAVSPGTVTLVAGGVPVTVVVCCGTEPM